MTGAAPSADLPTGQLASTQSRGLPRTVCTSLGMSRCPSCAVLPPPGLRCRLCRAQPRPHIWDGVGHPLGCTKRFKVGSRLYSGRKACQYQLAQRMCMLCRCCEPGETHDTPTDGCWSEFGPGMRRLHVGMIHPALTGCPCKAMSVVAAIERTQCCRRGAARRHRGRRCASRGRPKATAAQGPAVSGVWQGRIWGRPVQRRRGQSCTARWGSGRELQCASCRWASTPRCG